MGSISEGIFVDNRIPFRLHLFCSCFGRRLCRYSRQVEVALRLESVQICTSLRASSRLLQFHSRRPVNVGSVCYAVRLSFVFRFHWMPLSVNSYRFSRFRKSVISHTYFTIILVQKVPLNSFLHFWAFALIVWCGLVLLSSGTILCISREVFICCT